MNVLDLVQYIGEGGDVGLESCVGRVSLNRACGKNIAIHEELIRVRQAGANAHVAGVRVHDKPPAGAAPVESNLCVVDHSDKGLVLVWRRLKQPKPGSVAWTARPLSEPGPTDDVEDEAGRRRSDAYLAVGLEDHMR